MQASWELSVGRHARRDTNRFKRRRVLYEADLIEARVGKKAQCPLCEDVIIGSFLASKEKRGRQKDARSPDSPAPLDSFDVNSGSCTKLSALLQDVESQEGSDKR
jgi:hypothetical protein